VRRVPRCLGPEARARVTLRKAGRAHSAKHVQHRTNLTLTPTHGHREARDVLLEKEALVQVLQHRVENRVEY
jgi:hypothetical protein